MEFKLGKVSKFYDSLHKTPKDYNIYGYPMVRVKDISTGFLDLSSCFNVSEVDYLEFSKKYKPQSGDIIITRVGTYGNIALVTDDTKFCLGQNTVILNVDQKMIDNKYLFYYLTSSKGQQQIESRVTGSTQKTISLKSLKEINIIRHDYYKEKQIGNLLYKIDNKINSNKQIVANLEELSQTLFKRWFVDFEFPDENGNPYKSSGGEMVDSELGEIPRSWKVDELGNYIKIKSGKRPKNKVDKKDIENVVPIIGASKIMGYTNDYLYNEKIIIIGRVGTHGVIQRFSTRTWPSDNTFVITSDFESIIYQVLKSIDYISLNRGSTQPLLSQKDIKNTKVVMPTNATLLSKYQKENNHILKMMDQKNIENQKLAQLRDTLLPKLMSGEIEIPDDIEVMEDELSI